MKTLRSASFTVLCLALTAISFIHCSNKQEATTQAGTDATTSAKAPPSPGVFHSRLNVLLVCSSCGIDSAPSTPHTIFLDQDTGDIWAYRDFTRKPVYLGRIEKMGEPAKLTVRN